MSAQFTGKMKTVKIYRERRPIRWTFEYLSYAAGLVDGEGCIGVYHNSHNGNYQLRLSIDMVEPIAINLCHDLFGGVMYQKNKFGYMNRRDTNMWLVFNNEAANSIRAIEPYLRVKKTQAQSVLHIDWLAGSGGQKISEEDKNLRMQSCAILKKLNQRGVIND